MKKTIIILITVLMVMPLFSRGVTESVSREGVKGIATYLKELDKVKTDKRVTDESRDEIEEAVYNGKTLDEALEEYRLKEEAERLELEKAERERLEAEEEAKRIAEDEAKRTAEEEAKRTAEEEAKRTTEEEAKRTGEEEAKRAAEESEKTVRNDSVTAESSSTTGNAVLKAESESATDDPVLWGTFTYDVYSTDVVVTNTTASFTVPEGIEREIIELYLKRLASVYDVEAGYVSYNLTDDSLVLTYPRMSDEYVISAFDELIETLSDLIGEYAISAASAENEAEISDVPEREESAIGGAGIFVDADGTIRAEFNYHDILSASVVLESDMATVTYQAEYVFRSDIDAFMAEMVAQYGEALAGVSYEVPEDGTLVIYFPSESAGDTTYERLAVLDEVNSAVTAYIDAFVERLLSDVKETNVRQDKDIPAVVITETVTSSEAEMTWSIVGAVFDYRGVHAEFSVYPTYAVLTLPEGTTEDDVTSTAQMLCSAYPAESALVSYSLDDGVLTLYYPQQNSEYVTAAINQLGQDAKALIDSLYASQTQSVTEEESAASDVISPEAEMTWSIVGAVFDYRGVHAEFSVYPKYAVLTLPEGTTEDDVTAIAQMLCLAYPAESAQVKYVLDGNVLTLYYPQQNAEYVTAAINQLAQEARTLIDSLYASQAKTEEKTEEVSEVQKEESAAVESAVAEKSVTEAKEENNAPGKQEDTAVTASAEVSSDSESIGTASGAEKKSNFLFTFDIAASLRGKFVHYKGDPYLFPSLTVTLRETFVDRVYIEAGFDTVFYVDNSTFFIVGSPFLNSGVVFSVGPVDFYAYAGLRFQIVSKSSTEFTSGVKWALGAGIEYNINDNLSLGAGIEYFEKKSLFNVRFRYILGK